MSPHSRHSDTIDPGEINHYLDSRLFREGSAFLAGLGTYAMRDLQRCNEHRFDELAEFVADDVNGPTEGLSRYIAGLYAVVDAFPDYEWELQRLLVDDQWLAARLYGTGAHTGLFRGIAATGRVPRTQELVIYRTVDGKIVECWCDIGSTVRDELTGGTTAA